MSTQTNKNFYPNNNVTVEPFRFWKSPKNGKRYNHQCADCGERHKYRSRNKNPELCRKCAARKTQLERWRVIRRALAEVES